MSVTLFDKFEREELRNATFSELTYQYLNISARPEIGRIRELLENWFESYPEDEKNELKTRFKITFEPTFFELFIYTYFTKLGFSLSVHPDLPETLKHPDFLAEKNGISFYIEVKYAYLITDKTAAQERILNNVYDALGTLETKDFLINVDSVNMQELIQPNLKNLRNAINKKLKTVDYESYMQKYLRGNTDIEPIVYDDGNLKLILKLMPLPENARGKTKKTLGVISSEPTWGGEVINIYSALREKAQRYKNPDKPLLICLGYPNLPVTEFDINNVLFGSLAVTYSTEPGNPDPRTERADDGIFGTRLNPLHSRMSAIFLTGARPDNLSLAKVKFVRHPFAKLPLDIDMLPAIQNVFPLPENWPFN